MTIADKLLELNDVKQDIKTAIEGKGVDMTGVPFTGYPTKIDSITTGTGMSYHDYAKNLYTMWGYEAFFTAAWTESQNSLEVLFEIPLMLVAANQNMVGMDLDIYVGTNSALTNFYNLVAGGEFPDDYAIIINKSVIRYEGDMGPDVGMPFPVYAFGYPSESPAAIDNFFLADLTMLEMGLGIVLIKVAGNVIPDNSITIRRGFESYEAGLIIPEMIEIVGEFAFDSKFNAIRVPYIIGHNVKYIGENGFGNNLDYKLPLNIPDSVEWIGGYSFGGNWHNSNFIVIPRNVTYIGPAVFVEYGEKYKPPVVIMHPEVPPVLGFEGAYGPFPYNTLKIYVPDNAVASYISAWSTYADKIEAISSLPSLEENIDELHAVVELTQAQYDALPVYDDNTYYLIVGE